VHVPAAACVQSCTRSNTNVIILSNHEVLTRGSNISQVMSSKATKEKALDTTGVLETVFVQYISQSHANFMMTPTILSSISMYPHERDYVKSLFENPGKALTSKCPKNDKNPHDCDCAL